MLAEHFIASVGSLTRAPGPGISKDAAIFLHEFQPLSQQRQILKKSATPPNCLAVSATHIFAAQADKGVVHVYHREKGSQEAIVPFTEKISSIALACNDLVLVIGTVEGRIFLWETHTGRQVTTTQAHLQAVSVLAVDPTQNFLLSGSDDSSVNVWSIPDLLSFSRLGDAVPLRTFSSHRAEVTGLVVGHSSSSCNFAVSTSRDRTALLWDFRTGNVLRTYLLPGIPLCVELDPADRAVYLGYEDGSLHSLNLLTSPSGHLDAVQNGTDAMEPVQPSTSSTWKLPDASHGAALCLSVSFDGSSLVSGHQSGSIISWDVARGRFNSILTQAALPGPINCLTFLPVNGFPDKSEAGKVKINEIVKPKFGAFDVSDTGSVPGNYTMAVQLTSDLSSHESPSDFQLALTAPSFPTSLLDQGLLELANWGKGGQSQTNGSADDDEDFMALDDAPTSNGQPSLQEQNQRLKLELEAARRVQKAAFDKIDKLSLEKKSFLEREQSRLAKKSGTKANGIRNHDDDDDSSD